MDDSHNDKLKKKKQTQKKTYRRTNLHKVQNQATNLHVRSRDNSYSGRRRVASDQKGTQAGFYNANYIVS